MFDNDIDNIYLTIMSRLNKKPLDGLRLYYQRQVLGEYHSELKLFRIGGCPIESLKWYLRKITAGKEWGLNMGSIYRRQMFPVIDADDESAMVPYLMEERTSQREDNYRNPSILTFC